MTKYERLLWELFSATLLGIVAIQQGEIEKYNRENLVKIVRLEDKQEQPKPIVAMGHGK